MNVEYQAEYVEVRFALTSEKKMIEEVTEKEWETYVSRVTRIFQSIGFTVIETAEGETIETLIEEAKLPKRCVAKRGKEELNCYPMQISGTILKKNATAIRRHLESAAMTVYELTMFEAIHDQGEVWLLDALFATQRDRYSELLLRQYKTGKRKDFKEFVYNGTDCPIRLLDDKAMNVPYNTFISTLIADLVREGLMIVNPDAPDSYRSANKLEQKEWWRTSVRDSNINTLRHVLAAVNM